MTQIKKGFFAAALCLLSLLVFTGAQQVAAGPAADFQTAPPPTGLIFTPTDGGKGNPHLPPPAQVWTARYWNIDSGESPAWPVTEPIVTKTETAINYDWQNHSPYPEINEDHFIARWVTAMDFEGGNYSFYTLSDDGIRVYVDEELIIDEWNDHGPTIFRVDKVMSAGIHEIHVEYYENRGSAVMKFSMVKMKAAAGKFMAEFFNNQNLQGAPVYQMSTTNIGYVWNLGSPDEAVTPDHFSARLTKKHGYSSGTKTFTVQADDGVRLYIDGVMEIDQWKDQPLSTYSVTKNLTPGLHTITIEYYENGGEASLIYVEE